MPPIITGPVHWRGLSLFPLILTHHSCLLPSRFAGACAKQTAREGRSVSSVIGVRDLVTILQNG